MKKPLKIGLIGNGKMGTLIKNLAPSFNIEITHVFDSSSPLEKEKNVSFDLLIDFSSPKLTLKHVQWAIDNNISLLIGTTGWLQDYFLVKELVEKSSIAVLYSPNYSLGMLLFAQVVKNASSLFKKHGEFFPSLFERHHKEKKDAPSGSCLMLESLLKDEGLTPTVCSERGGFTVGYHEVLFESTAERVLLSHEAFQRDSFAKGALLSAEWLKGKKGFFTAEDISL